MARAKVLIVDDSSADAGMLRRYLSSDDAGSYTINVAETGETGLDLVAMFRPDVLLLDFELPDMNGLEFLRELPARVPAGESTPVVLAVTGQPDPRVAAELIRSGAEDYISKQDANPENVRRSVRHGVRTRRLRSALAERSREQELSHEELVASLERASFVASCSEALSRSLSVDALLRTIGDLAVPSLADACFVDLVDNGQLVRRYMRADDTLKHLEARPLNALFSLDGYEGAAKVLRSGASAKYARSWLPALARWDTDVAAALETAAIESVIVVPMIFDGTGLGAITLVSERRLDKYAQDVAGELGRRASAAFANARAFEAERAAKRHSDETRKRLATLSQVSELFSRSLEWRSVLREMMRIVVPSACDYASIALVEGTVVRVVASSTDNEHLRPAPIPENRPILSQTEYYPDVGLMRRYSDVERTLHAIGDRSRGSFIRVPIISSNGRTIGDLVFSTSGERRLVIDDLGLAEDLGRRIGMYVETARAFERERDIAHSLQRSLLPAQIPPVPGVQFAARCVVGSGGAEVGGDWYDIIPLPNGYVAFAVGDVAGRGVLAAATMGQLRSSLRAYVLEGLGPAEALSRLNTFMLSQEGMQFATVAAGVIECATGVLTFASAGHLPPIIIDAEHGAELLEVPAMLPVGIVGDASFEQQTVTLKQGQTLALFTDGLVESRSVDIERGTGDLVARLTARAHPDELLECALADLPPNPTDDVTFLALRFLGIGAATIDGEVPRVLLTLPAIPQSAGNVRRMLQEFCVKIGLHGTRYFDLELAVGEAVANAIEHAYNGENAAIFSVYARAENRQVLVDVLDQGRWRDGTPTPHGQLSERGRGVGLMRALCDRVSIDRTIVGTRIRLTLALDESAQDAVG